MPPGKQLGPVQGSLRFEHWNLRRRALQIDRKEHQIDQRPAAFDSTSPSGLAAFRLKARRIASSEFRSPQPARSKEQYPVAAGIQIRLTASDNRALYPAKEESGRNVPDWKDRHGERGTSGRPGPIAVVLPSTNPEGLIGSWQDRLILLPVRPEVAAAGTRSLPHLRDA
jgi:hypothetical protein